ncbi:MAG: hypothetical protein AAF709_16790, partial [Pseudomonadota bacterium]
DELEETLNQETIAQHYAGPTTPKSKAVGFNKALKKIRDGESVTAQMVNRVLKAFRLALRDLLIVSNDQQTADAMVRREEAQLRKDYHLRYWDSIHGEAEATPITARDFRVQAHDQDDRTRALATHDPAPFRNYFNTIKQVATDSGTADTFEHICSFLGAEFVEGRPDAAELSSTTVLGDSLVFDHSDWKAVDEAALIWTRPISACFSTRIVRVRIPDDPPSEIAFEFNTAGFGVFPVPDPMQPKNERPRFIVQRQTWMSEMPNNGRTSYLVYPITSDMAGEEVEFCLRALLINSQQDQLRRRESDGEWVTSDWNGKRVTPNSIGVDMSIIFPVSPRLGQWHFAQRPESAKRDQDIEIDPREMRFNPGDQLPGSGRDGSKVIWYLPDVEEPTIFSFRWSWEWD